MTKISEEGKQQVRDALDKALARQRDVLAQFQSIHQLCCDLSKALRRCNANSLQEVWIYLAGLMETFAIILVASLVLSQLYITIGLIFWMVYWIKITFKNQPISYADIFEHLFLWPKITYVTIRRIIQKRSK